MDEDFARVAERQLDTAGGDADSIGFDRAILVHCGKIPGLGRAIKLFEVDPDRFEKLKHRRCDRIPGRVSRLDFRHAQRVAQRTKQGGTEEPCAQTRIIAGLHRMTIERRVQTARIFDPHPNLRDDGIEHARCCQKPGWGDFAQISQ